MIFASMARVKTIETYKTGNYDFLCQWLDDIIQKEINQSRFEFSVEIYKVNHEMNIKTSIDSCYINKMYQENNYLAITNENRYQLVYNNAKDILNEIYYICSKYYYKCEFSLDRTKLIVSWK